VGGGGEMKKRNKGKRKFKIINKEREKRGGKDGEKECRNEERGKKNF